MAHWLKSWKIILQTVSHDSIFKLDFQPYLYSVKFWAPLFVICQFDCKHDHWRYVLCEIFYYITHKLMMQSLINWQLATECHRITKRNIKGIYLTNIDWNKNEKKLEAYAFGWPPLPMRLRLTPIPPQYVRTL